MKLIMVVQGYNWLCLITNGHICIVTNGCSVWMYVWKYVEKPQN